MGLGVGGEVVEVFYGVVALFGLDLDRGCIIVHSSISLSKYVLIIMNLLLQILLDAQHA